MIQIECIPHDKQRYNTVGDWQFLDEQQLQGQLVTQVKVPELKISVSDTGNNDYNTLLIVHELIEAILCKKAGITTEQVDKFDTNLHYQTDAKLSGLELGDLPYCPYKKQHQFATKIEQLLAIELGVDWLEYEKCLESL